MSSADLPLLAGRRGLVLGVSSDNSVGYECARHLQRLGARIAFTHRPGNAAAERLATALGCEAFELEATDEQSVARALSQGGESLQRIDFIVHTLVHVPSGVLERPALELSADDFRVTMEVGVRSLLAACRYALPWLERSDAPRVVALLSSGADFAIPNYHAAGIAKAGLASALRYLALELGPKGVLCNGVSFSIVDTDAARRVIGAEQTKQTRDYLAKRAPSRRAVEYQDVTSSIAFFASDLCRNVTGEILTVDGGFSRAYF